MMSTKMNLSKKTKCVTALFISQSRMPQSTNIGPFYDIIVLKFPHGIVKKKKRRCFRKFFRKMKTWSCVVWVFVTSVFSSFRLFVVIHDSQKTRLEKTRQEDRIRHDKTRQDKIRQNKTRQDMIRQNRQHTKQQQDKTNTRQDKHKTRTGRYKTRQDKTRQDKAR